MHSDAGVVPASGPATGLGPLREVAPDGLRIGTAVAGGGHHVDQPVSDPFAADAEYRALIGREFDSVSPENQLKWEMVHPGRDEYDFEPADRIAEFAEEHAQVVRGHTLGTSRPVLVGARFLHR